MIIAGYIGGPISSRSNNGGSDLQCIPKGHYEITGRSPPDIAGPAPNMSNTLITEAIFDVDGTSTMFRKQIACSICLIQRRAQVSEMILVIYVYNNILFCYYNNPFKSGV